LPRQYSTGLKTMSLVDFQRRLIQCLLHQTPVPVSPEEDFPRRSAAGFDVHRRTILTGLVNAMRSTFPTVAKLMEEPSFRRIASAYASINAPRDPVLFLYADSFPHYLTNHPDCAPYMSDVARFDLAIDRTAHQEDAGYCFTIQIGSKIDMTLHTSLQYLRFGCATDLIRSATESRAPLSEIQPLLQAAERHLAIWRSPDGVAVKSLSPAVATFLEALLRRADVTAALEESIGDADMEPTVRAIEAELFSSTCVRLKAH
jgi:hypothetical protein